MEKLLEDCNEVIKHFNEVNFNFKSSKKLYHEIDCKKITEKFF